MGRKSAQARSTSQQNRFRRAIGAVLKLVAVRFLVRVAPVAACLLLGACGDNDEVERTSARSWSATAQAVGQMWLDEEVPSAFTRQALRKAARELEKGPLPRSALPVDELREAVERGDRDAASRLLDDVAPR